MRFKVDTEWEISLVGYYKEITFLVIEFVGGVDNWKIKIIASVTGI